MTICLTIYVEYAIFSLSFVAILSIQDRPIMHSHITNSTSNLPLIRLSSINPFLLELTRRKVDAAALLREMDLPGKVPATNEVFVPAPTIYRLVEKTASVANDPYLGFSVGQRLDLHAWGPIANAVAEAQTVGDLLNRFIVNAMDYCTGSFR